MRRLTLALDAITALTAIFVIPNAYTPTQIAKASQCSSSGDGSSFSNSQSVTTPSGTCSTSSAGTSNSFTSSFAAGSWSSCTAASTTQNPGQQSGEVSCH